MRERLAQGQAERTRSRVIRRRLPKENAARPKIDVSTASSSRPCSPMLMASVPAAGAIRSSLARNLATLFCWRAALARQRECPCAPLGRAGGGSLATARKRRLVLRVAEPACSCALGLWALLKRRNFVTAQDRLDTRVFSSARARHRHRLVVSYSRPCKHGSGELQAY